MSQSHGLKQWCGLGDGKGLPNYVDPEIIEINRLNKPDRVDPKNIEMNNLGPVQALGLTSG